MNKFEQGKRYIFSRDKWLADTGNVLLYQGNPYLRQKVDEAHGQEVETIEGYDKYISVDGFITTVKYCDIIESKRRTTFRDAVNHLLLRDKQAQLHEVINMLCSEKKRLERRLGAINKIIAQRELELFELDMKQVYGIEKRS